MPRSVNVSSVAEDASKKKQEGGGSTLPEARWPPHHQDYRQQRCAQAATDVVKNFAVLRDPGLGSPGIAKIAGARGGAKAIQKVVGPSITALMQQGRSIEHVVAIAGAPSSSQDSSFLADHLLEREMVRFDMIKRRHD